MLQVTTWRQLVSNFFRLEFLQACAAVGQPHLMRYYDDFFSALGVVPSLANAAVASQIFCMGLLQVTNPCGAFRSS